MYMVYIVQQKGANWHADAQPAVASISAIRGTVDWMISAPRIFLVRRQKSCALLSMCLFRSN
jgi:hypothetical protein